MARQQLELRVSPGGRLSGRIQVPGDKSISHRAIMLGAVAEGHTTIRGFLEGEDALATIQAFRAMGVGIDGPCDARVLIHGVGLRGLRGARAALDLGNSGTGMRLLAGLLAGQDFDSVLTGDDSLRARPMGRIAAPLERMGAIVEMRPGATPPIRIRAPGRALRAIDYDMPVASAQVKSCVLLAGLYADGETCVREPAPTRDHTERMLRCFGYEVRRAGPAVCLSGGGTLHGADIDVPGDFSSAAFFLVGASVSPGSDLLIENVGINPTRTGALDILRLMGADIAVMNPRTVGAEPVADLRVRHAPLRGISVPTSLVSRAIDEFPALFVAAACARGTTVVAGAEELRVKESDRISVMASGLGALGIDARPTETGIIIQGGHLTGGNVHSGGDHRIAMAFAMAGLNAAASVHIDDCANVSTSFPGFVPLAAGAGLMVGADGG